MAIQEWHTTVDAMTPHVVRISTPRGSGSGFLLSHGKNNSFVAVATAAHVVDHAHYWEEAIRIDHIASGKSQLLRVQDRVVFLDIARDTAAVLFKTNDLPLPTDVLPLAPDDKFLKVGNDIGWLGFPAVAPSEMCFFSGHVSAYRPRTNAYLVDGVAINGVSGGPAFHPTGTSPWVIGVISAYMPNRATGEVLPGLTIVQGVRHFHELAPTFASLDEAKEQETPPIAPPPPPPSDAQVEQSHTGR